MQLRFECVFFCFSILIAIGLDCDWIFGVSIDFQAPKAQRLANLHGTV